MFSCGKNTKKISDPHLLLSHRLIGVPPFFSSHIGLLAGRGKPLPFPLPFPVNIASNISKEDVPT